MSDEKICKEVQVMIKEIKTNDFKGTTKEMSKCIAYDIQKSAELQQKASRTQRDTEIQKQLQKWIKSGKPYFIYFTKGFMRDLANVLQTEIRTQRDAEWKKAIDETKCDFLGQTKKEKQAMIYLSKLVKEKLKSTMEAK